MPVEERFKENHVLPLLLHFDFSMKEDDLQIEKGTAKLGKK